MCSCDMRSSRSVLLALVLLVGTCGRAEAQIANPTASYATPATTATLTWAHTISGSDTGLVAWSWTYSDATTSGCTFNGTSMTFDKTVSSAVGSHLSSYVQVNPAAGTHNIVCTNTGSAANSAGGALSYTGLAQTGQPDSSGSATATSSTTVSASTTVVATGSWLVMGAVSSIYGTTMTAGASTTLRGSPNWIGVFDSNGTVSTGSQALAAADGSAAYWEAIVLSIAPVGGGGAPSPSHRMLMGVGK